MFATRVLDVHKENLNIVWDSMISALHTSDFVAVDLELSGLGDRKGLSNHCLEERFKSISEAARTRSIISLGISCFKQENQPDCDYPKSYYVTQTFNIFSLCSEPYTVEPEALTFLTHHGFNFNKQYSLGLPYTKGSMLIDGKVFKKPSLRLLFLVLCGVNKPIIFHNGLVDLVFLYQNLYLDLPLCVSAFLADIEDLFPSGVYDTKYIAENHIGLNATFLQFAFSSCFLWNKERAESIHFTSGDLPASTDIYSIQLQPAETNDDSKDICLQYSIHGWCSKGFSCSNSHNITTILARKSAPRMSKKKRRKLRRLKEKQLGISHLPSTLDGNIEITTSRHENTQNNFTSMNHRAGVDAFMTGYCFACFESQLTPKRIPIKSFKNMMYLSGREIPLLVTKGNFGKLSQTHKMHQLVIKQFKS